MLTSDHFLPKKLAELVIDAAGRRTFIFHIGDEDTFLTREQMQALMSVRGVAEAAYNRDLVFHP